MSDRPAGLENATVMSEYKNPKDGRRLVYYFVKGPTYAEDRIFKYLQFLPRDPEGPTFYKELPADWINRNHQYSMRARDRNKNGCRSPSKVSKDLAIEEQRGFDSLYRDRGRGRVKRIRRARRTGSSTSTLRHDMGAPELEAVGETSTSSDTRGAAPPLTGRVTVVDDVSNGGDEDAQVSDDGDSDVTMVGGESNTAENDAVKLPPLLRLPKTLLSRILVDVLSYRKLGPPLALHDLSTIPPVFYTCRQLRFESWNVWVRCPLHILLPLPRDVDRTTRAQLAGIEAIYGSDVPNLTLYSCVVNEITAYSIEQLQRKLANEPGLSPESQIFYLEKGLEGFGGLRVYTPGVLMKKMRDSPEKFGIGSRYCLSYAPTHHLNIFGWMRYAELTVANLTIQLQETETWKDAAAGCLSGTTAISIIALIASIIVFKPRGVKTITLKGLADFRDFFEEGWRDIPDRTPLVGRHNQLLDSLARYPFDRYYRDIKEIVPDGDGGLMERHRWGNLFGLTSEAQWEGMILMARYGRQYPSWQFVA